MDEYSLISKKEIRMNKTLKSIQKVSCKKYRAVKGHFPKAQIGKVVKLREHDCFYDFTNYSNTHYELHNPTIDILLRTIKQQGILGLSGSAFPTEQKIQSLLDSKTEEKYLIINGVECDPGLIHDEWLLKNYLEEIEKGIALITKCIPFNKVILATKEALTKHQSYYDIYRVPNRYPMGAEKILIQTVLNISLDQQDTPSAKGILVLNVQTIHAIYEAFYQNRVLDSRFITIADMLTGEAVIARVNLNASILDIASKFNKANSNQPVYFGGGIMSGKRATAEDKLSVKTNFIGYGKEVCIYQNLSCKKCGACSRKCPMNISVHKIIQSLEKNDLSRIKDFHSERCIQCGTCSYFCHARKNTMEMVISTK